MIKYLIVDKPLHTNRSDLYRNVLDSFKQPIFKEIFKDYDNYELLLYFLVSPPVNFGKYTLYPSPLKYKIQNDKNAYIGTTPIDDIVDDKSFLNLNYLDFYPKSYNNKLNKIEYEYYIVKPISTCGGKGITIINKNNLKKEYKNHIIQRYIENPYLIDGHKFDIRVNVLYIDKKVYVYHKTTFRLASKKYNYNNQTDIFAGLTNFSLHKNEKYIIFPENYMNKKEYNKLFSKLKDITKQFFQFLQKEIKMDFWNDKDNHYFNLFGFDYLIDDNGKIWLLEVNKRPGGLFNDIYKIMIQDMIKIIYKQEQSGFEQIL